MYLYGDWRVLEIMKWSYVCSVVFMCDTSNDSDSRCRRPTVPVLCAAHRMSCQQVVHQHQLTAVSVHLRFLSFAMHHSQSVTSSFCIVSPCFCISVVYSSFINDGLILYFICHSMHLVLVVIVVVERTDDVA